jgi:hypothetical protein
LKDFESCSDFLRGDDVKFHKKGSISSLLFFIPSWGETEEEAKMPKKFVGENTKAVAARSRKADAKNVSSFSRWSKENFLDFAGSG